MRKLRWIALCLLIVGGLGLTWMFFNDQMVEMLTLLKVFCGMIGAGLLLNLAFCLWRLQNECKK